MERRLQHAIKFARDIPKQNLTLDAYSLPGAYHWNPHACLHKELPWTYIYNYLKTRAGGGGGQFPTTSNWSYDPRGQILAGRSNKRVNPRRLGTKYLASKHLAPSVKFKTQSWVLSLPPWSTCKVRPLRRAIQESTCKAGATWSWKC